MARDFSSVRQGSPGPNGTVFMGTRENGTPIYESPTQIAAGSSQPQSQGWSPENPVTTYDTNGNLVTVQNNDPSAPGAGTSLGTVSGGQIGSINLAPYTGAFGQSADTTPDQQTAQQWASMTQQQKIDAMRNANHGGTHLDSVMGYVIPAVIAAMGGVGIAGAMGAGAGAGLASTADATDAELGASMVGGANATAPTVAASAPTVADVGGSLDATGATAPTTAATSSSPAALPGASDVGFGSDVSPGAQSMQSAIDSMGDAGSSGSGSSILDSVGNALGKGASALGTGALNTLSSPLGLLTALSLYGQYRNHKTAQQQSAALQAQQQARQHAIDVNPNTGGSNPIPTSLRQYYGTPNYNPFVKQSPSDRLAFGPAPWQIGGDQQSPSPTQVAHGGYMGGGHAPQGGLGMLARGPGGGQGDKIPAMLSDGEYVMDASTVSDLGDGSTDEGARRLDQMRQNVRKHKRSTSARDIPPKAKHPESYLRGK